MSKYFVIAQCQFLHFSKSRNMDTWSMFFFSFISTCSNVMRYAVMNIMLKNNNFFFGITQTPPSLLIGCNWHVKRFEQTKKIQCVCIYFKDTVCIYLLFLCLFPNLHCFNIKKTQKRKPQKGWKGWMGVTQWSCVEESIECLYFFIYWLNYSLIKKE